MSDYLRIENVQDQDQVYAELVKIFGKKIFQDKYRAVGAFLDIAPKMKEEASYLLKAFDAGVPQYLAGASGLDKEKAFQLIADLKAKGISNDIAIDLLENIGHALGIKVNIRPDYSKGGMIPYTAQKSDSLSTAIQKLDHIRWFLNNSGKYHMKGLENELKEMRKLMNNPQRNEAELITKYDKLVHKFQNDPFSECFLFDKGKDADIKSNYFGAYFIIVGGTPVALEFARQYGGTEYSNGIKNLKSKYSAMLKKVEAYTSEVSSINFASNGGGKKGKGIAFIIFAILIMLLIRRWLTFRFAGSGLLSFWTVLKNNHLAIWKVLAGIPSVSHPVGYSVILIVSGLILLCVVILIINLCKTIRNIARTKGTKGPVNKKNKLLHTFGNTIPDKINSVMADMELYISGKKKTLELTKQDYRSSVNEIQNLKSVKVSGNITALVPGGGKKALGWMIALSVILSIMSTTQLRNASIASGSELNSVVALKESVSDTVIPKNALYYGDHYYAVYDDADSWMDAFNQCLKLGGHLATISSEEEDIALATYIKNKDLDVVFMGLVYTSSSKMPLNWYWFGYEGMSYTDWTEGEPSIGDEGDCIYGAFSKSDNYQWRALPGDYSNYYICEWDSLDAAKVDQRLLDIPIGSMNFNGHYYAILEGAETYDDAVQMCKKLGGYMCMIDYEEENTALYNYIHSRGYDSVYFGYSDQDLEGKWKWAYTDASGEYTRWAEGEPNGETSENYGMFYYASAEYCWNDGKWGGENAPFLCEWDLTLQDTEQTVQ